MNSQGKLSTLFLIDMKTFSTTCFMNFWKRFSPFMLPRNFVLALTLGAPIALSAANTGQTFATPEAAVAALAVAANAQDTNALRLIFGPASADIENPDRVQAAGEYRAFAEAVAQDQRIVRESDSKCVLKVGHDFWPFAVPIVKKDGQWFFDTVAGIDEILSRRIGKNELSTLQALRGCAEAQREYAAKDRDGDLVLEYAQKLASKPGTKDGLYWPSDLDGEISPLGPLFALAQEEGYLMKAKEEGAAREPFHGYFFKVLTRQAKSAPGGKYDYLINGNMIGGFAIVAWPAEYGETGIMTFIVNQLGTVYQKDLGPKTAKIAAAMKEYDPDKTWVISRD
jgi:hypothetical protein